MDANEKMSHGLTRYRLLMISCGLTALLYPGWSGLLHLWLPNVHDRPLQRVLLGTVAGLLVILGHKKILSETAFGYLAPLLFQVVNLHFIFLVYEANYSPVYVIGNLIVVSAYTVLAHTYRDLFIYSVVIVVGASIASMSSGAPLDVRFMTFGGIVTILFVGLSSLNLRIRLHKSLEDEKGRSLKLSQQLIEKDLESAEAVQKTLLARKSDIDGLEVNSFYKSADRTGGDWYGQYYSEATSVFYFWIGDVTGHGVSSALLTGVACGALYSGERRADHLGSSSPVEERLHAMAVVLNTVLYETGNEKLMTMLFCALDQVTGEFHWLNAGHNFPYVIDSHRQAVKPLVNNGPPLGLEPRISLPQKRIILHPGDKIFAYTDGLIENRSSNNEALSNGKLYRILSSAQGRKAPIKTVLEQSRHYCLSGSRIDDVSLIEVNFQSYAPPIQAKKA